MIFMTHGFRNLDPHNSQRRQETTSVAGLCCVCVCVCVCEKVTSTHTESLIMCTFSLGNLQKSILPNFDIVVQS